MKWGAMRILGGGGHGTLTCLDGITGCCGGNAGVVHGGNRDVS